MPLRMLSMPGKEKNPFGEHEALRGFTLCCAKGKRGNAMDMEQMIAGF